MTEPYSLPASLEPDLRRALDYWESLIKGANNMPFWDDFRAGALPDLSPRMALLDVFDEPLRLRFGDFVGLELIQRYGAPLHGQFLDELQLTDPFEHLASQASAAIEDSKPNYYRHSAREGYSRLLAPMWGSGRVWALLCRLCLALIHDAGSHSHAQPRGRRFGQCGAACAGAKAALRA